MITNCHRRTFLQQHAQWAAALLTALRAEQQRGQQQQQQPSAVAAEACACLAAYFGRVGRMLEVPGLRRDGAAAASKLAAILLQQGQKQQQQEAEQAGQAAAAPPPPLLLLPQGQAALLAALSALPASFRQQLKALEAALLPLLMSPAAGGGSAMLAACVAALPRIAGDGSTWSAFCQRLLLTAHRLLDALLLGLDDSQLAAAVRTATDPAAEPLPLLPSSGTGALAGEAYAAAFGQLAAVLETLRQMLSGSYPAAVPLPAGGLLLLVSRIASLDDSSAGGRATAAAAASSRFPHLCLQLPGMQAAALAALQQMLAVAGAAAAPYFVAASRLLSELLQRSAVGVGGGALATSALVSDRHWCCKGSGLSLHLPGPLQCCKDTLRTHSLLLRPAAGALPAVHHCPPAAGDSWRGGREGPGTSPAPGRCGRAIRARAGAAGRRWHRGASEEEGSEGQAGSSAGCGERGGGRCAGTG